MSQCLRLLSLLCLFLTTGCQHNRKLPADVSAALHLAAEQPESSGELIYNGTVTLRDSDRAPLFRYERRVLDGEEEMRSAHVTFSTADEPVVLHHATHSQTYQLIAFHEIHAQLGLFGHVEVAPDGTARFQTTVHGRTRTRVEPPGAPLQVGPTLFGYVLTHWDSLTAGELHPVRFVVLEKTRSYPFTVQVVDGPPGTTTFEMIASNRFVGLGLPSIQLVFDQDRKLLSYSGLVPPYESVGNRLKTLDATVTYELTAETYR